MTKSEIASILWPSVSGKHGAPMGRPNCASYTNKKGETLGLDVNEHAPPFHLVQVPRDSGGYEPGGAYWGWSPTEKLYGYIGPSTDIRGFIWAKSRDDAKIQIKKTFQHARFFQ